MFSYDFQIYYLSVIYIHLSMYLSRERERLREKLFCVKLYSRGLWSLGNKVSIAPTLLGLEIQKQVDQVWRHWREATWVTSVLSYFFLGHSPLHDRDGLHISVFATSGTDAPVSSSTQEVLGVCFHCPASLSFLISTQNDHRLLSG